MLWSSAIPLALPFSLLVGVLSYREFHSLGFDPVSCLVAAKVCTGIANLLVGVPKNALTGDVLSLVLVRPLSLIAAVLIVSHLVGLHF